LHFQVQEARAVNPVQVFIGPRRSFEAITPPLHRDADMYYEPDTVWGRTIDGDREVDAPRSGLSITQRRVLKRLETPRTFATFAAINRLPPPKLEHELIALAQMHLVAFQRPGATRPRTAPTINLPLSAGAESVAHTPVPERTEVPLPVAFAAVGLGIVVMLLIMT
jgi:hypothetical protein